MEYQQTAQSLKFDAHGLIPAIVQDHYTKQVLTLAYMNAETLALTIAEGRTVFWSRSRGQIWRKGETSGNVQRVVSITADCDKDALVVEVIKDGPACHTGAESCFFNPVYVSDELKQFTWQGLYDLIEGRKTDPQEGSYTSYLFDKGLEKILKKVGEECTEVIGSGGKVVRGIQDETGASIDIQEDGTIHIAAVEGTAGEAAKKMILDIVKEPEVGEEYEGEVVGIKDFGAFVKLTPAKDGLLHISRVANGRVATVEDVLSLGDVVKVKVLEVDPKTGKISLDRLDKPDAPESAGNGGRGSHGHGGNGGGHGRGNGGKVDNHPGRAGRTPRRRHEAN